MVVPAGARAELLRRLHKSHLGENATKRRARELFYWPNMGQQIEDLIRRCQACRALAPSRQKEELQQESAARPMELICVELFEAEGKTFLAFVDAFTGYPFLEPLKTTGTTQVCQALEKWFNVFGYPRRIRTDGGPQFRGPFKQWCEDTHIKHDLSSPYHPQSNGRAEATVKNLKRIIIKCSMEKESIYAALLEFRNTPREDGPSPNKMMFCRSIRGAKPMPRVADDPLTEAQTAGAMERQKGQARAKAKFDKSTKTIKHVTVGSHVVVQNLMTKVWDRQGEVIWLTKDERSAYVKEADGVIFRRNRRFLRPIPAESAECEPSPGALKSQDSEETSSVKLRRSARIAERNSQ